MTPLTTKLCLAAGLLLAGMPACIQAQGTNTPTGMRLQALGDPNGVRMGTAISYEYFPPNGQGKDYTGTASAEYDLFTPEGEMEMSQLEPTQGNYAYTNAAWNTYTIKQFPADWEVNWVNSIGGAMHGHPLITYDPGQLPGWVKPPNTWTATSLTNVMYDYIDTILAHWNGKIAVWNVVNEAFDFDAYFTTFDPSLGWTHYLHNFNNPNTDVWQEWIGPNANSTLNYIEMAFTRARHDDGAAILIYNDHGAEVENAKSDAMYNMVQDFQANKIPIDGIGFQCHFSEATPPDYGSFASNLTRFAQLGMKLYITEFDVLNPNGSLATTGSLGNDLEARIYYNSLDKCLRCPAVAGFQTWEFGDYFSWLGKAQYPLVFDATNPGMRAKPAYYALQDALAVQDRPELLSNIGFESGTSAWLTNGTCTLTSVAGGHSGNSAMSVTGRASSTCGPSQQITSALNATTEGAGQYYMGAWVKFTSGSGTVQLTLHTKDATEDLYPFASATVGTGWTHVGGYINVTWSKALSNATFYIQTPNSTADFVVDDVYLGDGNLAANGNFENGITSWTGSGCTLAATTDDPEYHYGAGGVKATALTAGSQGPQQNILSGLLARGPGNYSFQSYMKVSSSSTVTATGSIVLKLTYGGADHYITGASNTVTSLNWTKVASASPVSVQWTGSLTGAVLYLETPGSTTDFCADDVLMRQ